ncbi:glutamate-1-semialdehyde 2,1-aminomutase [Cryptococcus neoformans A2-102-5]|nr:glutamate-1-semialdehyde 2,1-aminomutase [Cryptococcus neoformans var. grubii D17-1]OXG94905.1 glutamate-1-semialdehyde 2,1-aminomutase [Cryptococcus neoformans var. grubii A2-102-5]
MKKFDAREEGAISHGRTFNNSPLTMVAGATAMERILTEDALKNLNALGDWMKEEINKMFTSDESPFLMTGLGSINQFHCTLSSNQNQVLDLLFFNLLERGFWITERGLVSLSFAMNEEDVQRFIVASIEATQKVKATLK